MPQRPYDTETSQGMSQLVMDIHELELDVGKSLQKPIKSKAALVEAWLDWKNIH